MVHQKDLNALSSVVNNENLLLELIESDPETSIRFKFSGLIVNFSNSIWFTKVVNF